MGKGKWCELNGTNAAIDILRRFLLFLQKLLIFYCHKTNKIVSLWKFDTRKESKYKESNVIFTIDNRGGQKTLILINATLMLPKSLQEIKHIFITV